MATMIRKLAEFWTASLEERGGTFPRSVGEAFLLLRRRAGLTQQELAARAGVSVGAVARAESGWGLPQPPGKAVKVLEVLGASTEQFVNLVDALWKTSEERFAAGEGARAAEGAAGEEAERVH